MKGLEEDPIEEYHPNEENKSQKVSLESLEKNLKIELLPRQKIISSEASLKPLAVALSLKQEIDEKNSAKSVQKAPIDLICVIDSSGSMSGSKINLVKKSIRYVLKVLSDKDRISLISFSNQSEILIPLLKNNSDNKNKIKKTLKNLTATGGTEIELGMKEAFTMLQNRKYKNPISLIFLLSDGQDNGQKADERVKKRLQELDIKENFMINTFGYGNDHDPDVMRNIAKMTQGTFYYIKDFSEVSKYFLLAVSGFLSLFLEDITITMKERKGFEIVKVYGENKV